MKKRDNFFKALTNLRDIYNYSAPYNNVELAGMVGLYEICFELAWKAMKEHLQQEGFPESGTGSPRQILKTAFQAGLIEDEADWLAALADRNNVAHSYDEQVALAIITRTKEQYCTLFEKLKEKLQDKQQGSTAETV